MVTPALSGVYEKDDARLKLFCIVILNYSLPSLLNWILSVTEPPLRLYVIPLYSTSSREMEPPADAGGRLAMYFRKHFSDAGLLKTGAIR